MPRTAPGAERLAGSVKEDARPAKEARKKERRARRASRIKRALRWTAGVVGFLIVIAVLFDAYLHLSKTYPENSDEANILLMANDMLHGNVILHNWSVSDVPFITTELPQMALLVWMFGLHLNTAHIAAAVTYTLIVAVAMLLAKGKARGWAAVARMALVLVILIAPQPGVGVFVVIFSVGHIGTALPVMLTWLVIDRLGRKWYVPVLVALLIGWAQTADPLVLVVAVFPLLAVCLARFVSALFMGLKEGRLAGLRAAALGRWFEVWLAAAAGIGYAIAWGAGQLISNHGGYVQQPVPYQFDWPDFFMQARIVVHGVLEMFGAYFVPGVDNFINSPISPAPPGILDQAFALTHLAGVILAVWGACAIARRFFFRDADFVSQLLLAGIVANLGAYIPSTLAHHTALNVREVAPVLPFAAVLAGRMLGDRLLTGPMVNVRPLRWLRSFVAFTKRRRPTRWIWSACAVMKTRWPLRWIWSACAAMKRWLRPLRWRRSTRRAMKGLTAPDAALAGAAITDAGPANTGLANTGLANTGLAGAGLADAASADGVRGRRGTRRRRRWWQWRLRRRDRARDRAGNGSRKRSLRVRLVAIPLVALLGWYSYGLFTEADTHAAPEPLTSLAAFLEAHDLTYGLGGYWDASVLTVETGGAVTIRAVTPACLQPYRWESKSDWYNPTQHYADFILLSTSQGYFNSFGANAQALLLLNGLSRPPFVNSRVRLLPLTSGNDRLWPGYDDYGSYQIEVDKQGNSVPIFAYTARVYPINLLGEFPQLWTALSSPTVDCG